MFEVEWTAMLGEPCSGVMPGSRRTRASSGSSSIAPGADRARPPQARAVAAAPRRLRARQLARPEVEPPPVVPRPRRDQPRRRSSRSSGSIRSSSGAASSSACSAAERARPSAERHRVPSPTSPRSTARRPRPIPATEKPTVTESEPPRPPSTQLADRFWEAILELNPTTATVYGDERYADRLEDPSPAGRARVRGAHGARRRPPPRRSRPTACPSRTGSPATC